MIISASRRTDIPAFFADWFFNRLKEGYVVTQNPFNASQLSRVELNSDVVDAIVFWTKNAAPMVGRLEELETVGIFFYFQHTITPYGQDIERRLPGDKSEIIKAFKAISERIGPERIILRYDPILFSDKYSTDFHKRAFEKCASLLEGKTKRVVISFLDMGYNNTQAIQKLGIYDGTTTEKTEVAKAISEIAASYGMTVETCAEEINLEACGIRHGCCIDATLIEKMTGKTFQPKGKQKDKSQRAACGCVESIDIGMYNTCLHGCAYCYANYCPGTIATNIGRHNDASPLLLGECDIDNIKPRKGQESLFVKEDLFAKSSEEQLGLSFSVDSAL